MAHDYVCDNCNTLTTERYYQPESGENDYCSRRCYFLHFVEDEG